MSLTTLSPKELSDNLYKALMANYYAFKRGDMTGEEVAQSNKKLIEQAEKDVGIYEPDSS